MTISSETIRVVYVGAGSVGPFAVPYRFLEDADLLVIKTEITTGIQSVLVLTTDYTLTGAGDAAGGALTLTGAHGALAATHRISIINDPDGLQELDYTPYDAFPAETHERGLDKLAIRSLRLADLINRSLRQPDGDDVNIGTIPAKVTRASMFLAFDANGEPIAAAGSMNALPVSAFVNTLLDDANAAAFLTTLGVTSFAQGLLGDADASKAAGRLGLVQITAEGGTANAQTGTIPANILSFGAEQLFIFTPSVTNTGAATLTLTPSGSGALAAKNIFANGAALTGGELVIGVPTLLQYDGAQLNIIGWHQHKPTVQVFTATGTWTKPAGCRGVIVEVQAPGGGGGGADSDGTGNAAGGSGGGGGYARKLIVTGLGATEAITIGSAGVGGSATGGTDGTAGGTTSFGAHVSCTGGGLGFGTGVATIAVTTRTGGAGGTGTGGDINIAGAAGDDGNGDNEITRSGKGGDAQLGRGGAASTATTFTAGKNGGDYGGGGSGGAANSNTTGAAGGNGGAGIIIVHEFY